jgi:Regulator of ribonuclease activity B
LPFWRRSHAGLDKRDAQTLAALRDAGSDLSKPAHVLVYLYFEDEGEARAAATQMGELGYEVRVTEPSHGVEQWAVVGETQLAPTPEAVAELRAALDGIAKRHRGEFDGWEASVEA